MYKKALNKPSWQFGFTLVEMLIVIAIIGILIKVGYPSYQNFVISGKRAAAQADLLALAAAMERHRAANYSYAGAASGGADTGSPSIFTSHSPSDSPASKKQYDLTIAELNNNGASFVIKATPVSTRSQATDGELYYFSDGRKAWDKNRDSSLSGSEYCWSC